MCASSYIFFFKDSSCFQYSVLNLKLCLKEVEDEIHFLLKCEALQNVRTPFIDLINNNNYNFKHLDIREQFIWLMSNEDNFIINQLSDMILKLHSSRNDIIQN